MENSSQLWQPEEITPRQKVIYFVIRRIKEGATKQQLMGDEVSSFIEENDLPSMLTSDAEGIVNWAIRKFAQ
jgi:hypothetical protein